ncbi:hypothetical protein PsorP6_006604 [Peronosclerospora sorghi]|uniref:Uncharacterized protein n=1 Tax=Peronosclerospora sorghi TaxID=230839 RepID=A0ACC0W3F7_9STRA|nr:hypothetical protein PsorP6_006604 [Peronosclerospora sorghi]
MCKDVWNRSGANDRYAALECLAKLATIPYELVHPYRDAVLQKLLLVLDDRKCPRVPDDVKANFATARPKLPVKVKSVAKKDVLFKNSPAKNLPPDPQSAPDRVHTGLTHGPLEFFHQSIRDRHATSSVFPQLQLVKDNCPGCGAVLGQFPVNTAQAVYRNFHKDYVARIDGECPPGRVPRLKDVILATYTNTPDPTLNLRDGFPVFRTVIEANNIERRADELGCQLLTADETKQILRFAKQPDIAHRLINSIEPSIYGHQQVKTALVLALFGGKAKFIKNFRVRGDLNVLMEGNPGTDKSQFLKFAKKKLRPVHLASRTTPALSWAVESLDLPVSRETHPLRLD